MKRATEWTPGPQRIQGVNCRYDGNVYTYAKGAKRPTVSYLRGRACFAAWPHKAVDKVTWYPNIDGLEYNATAEMCNRWGYENIYRKIFPIMPTWGALRSKTRRCMVTADLHEETRRQANFRWRILRSLHEEPSVFSSLATIHNLAPDLEPPWVLGLAVLGNWAHGTIERHIQHSHKTFCTSYEAGTAWSTARCFAHIYANNGWFNAGKLYEEVHCEENLHYEGVSEETANNPQFRITNAKNVKVISQPHAIKYMRRVREAHMKKPYGQVAPSIDGVMPAVNEDANRERIW